jgi:hypothetical protein
MMRIEYSIDLSRIDVPRFSVEAQEGIGKIFTLATLVLNVLEEKESVEVIFHGLNPEDPDRKITAFMEIIASAETAPPVTAAPRNRGRVAGSSSYFQWLVLTRA